MNSIQVNSLSRNSIQTSSKSSEVPLTALRLTLMGQVQGIGYRPALARLAANLNLCGWVANTPRGVQVHVEGESKRILQFTETCVSVCPHGGHVENVQSEKVPQCQLTSFQIIEGQQQVDLSTPVPVDRVVCQDCLDEVQDDSDRRHGYLLTSCSQCGPRFTIIEQMPYERDTSSMDQFAMCDACQIEYRNSSDRRFHAQTTCCALCGPNLTGLENSLNCLRSGNVLGVKGLGGYQLMVDATSDEAVQRLRKRKGRRAKPLAVMVANLAAARELAELLPDDETALVGTAGPIVICPIRSPRAGHRKLSEYVTEGLGSVGIMLPTTPLHVWLAENAGPLVVTSANVEGQPIVYESLQEIAPEFPLADAWIDHDRPIRRPIDDSVLLNVGQRTITVRSARGLAPRTLPLPTHLLRYPALAVGGNQKVAIALSNGHQAVLGPHLGDMGTTHSRRRFIEQVDQWCELYNCQPGYLVHDWHPDFFTTAWAKETAASHSLRLIAVQHHHAHIATGILEAGWFNRPVLGLSWDGTGLGTQEMIWGGETLVASLTDFRRVVTLRPFRMLGGEAAIAEPWRIATALIEDVESWDHSFRDQSPSSPASNHQLARALLTHSQFNIWTTSMGRLFDGVAALVLEGEIGRQPVGYEGHFAALLESLCNPAAEGQYPFPIQPSDNPTAKVDYELDWRPLIRAMIIDLRNEVPRSTVAMKFHRTIARAANDIIGLFPELPVVLAGGVFQNRILLQLIIENCESTGVPLALPSKIPINDGGLAAGQLAIALAQLEASECV